MSDRVGILLLMLLLSVTIAIAIDPARRFIAASIGAQPV